MCAPFAIDPPDGKGEILSLAKNPEPGGSLPQAVRDALAACRERRVRELIIPPGLYRLDGAEQVVLSGLRDLTVTAYGAWLIGRPGTANCALRIENCERVEVRGLTGMALR